MVHFAEAEEADMCVEYMNQRFLGKRRLLAATWDGKTKYDVEESEAEREERLKKWVEFLETGESSTTQSTTGGTTGAASAGNGASVSGNGAAVNTGVNKSTDSSGVDQSSEAGSSGVSAASASKSIDSDSANVGDKPVDSEGAATDTAEKSQEEHIDSKQPSDS